MQMMEINMSEGQKQSHNKKKRHWARFQLVSHLVPYVLYPEILVYELNKETLG